MSDFKKTSFEIWKIIEGQFINKDVILIGNEQWSRADFVKKEIEKISDDPKVSDGIIYSMEALLDNLGLSGEGQTPVSLPETEEPKGVDSRVKLTEDKGVSGLPTTNKFLLFKQINRPQIKTKVFYVYSTHSNVYLGSISWDTGWRRYTMNFEEDTKWSIECMAECYKFIAKLMQERKNNLGSAVEEEKEKKQ